MCVYLIIVLVILYVSIAVWNLDTSSSVTYSLHLLYNFILVVSQLGLLNDNTETVGIISSVISCVVG